MTDPVSLKDEVLRLVQTAHLELCGSIVTDQVLRARGLLTKAVNLLSTAPETSRCHCGEHGWAFDTLSIVDSRQRTHRKDVACDTEKTNDESSGLTRQAQQDERRTAAAHGANAMRGQRVPDQLKAAPGQCESGLDSTPETSSAALDEMVAASEAIGGYDLPEKISADQRKLQGFDTLAAFFGKYALGPKERPSCLVCGHTPEQWPPAIQHAELPGIVVCFPCRDAAQSAQKAAATPHRLDRLGDCINPGCTYPSVNNMDASRCISEKASAPQGFEIQCEVCKLTVIMPYTDESKRYIATEDAEGWTLYPKRLCPKHGAENGNG